MINPNQEGFWICQIILAAEDQTPVSEALADEFFQFTQDWVEDNGLQMGGMCYGKSELQDPIWDEIDGLWDEIDQTDDTE